MMGGKPSKGTKKDKRRKVNQPKPRKSKRPFARTRSADGRFPI